MSILTASPVREQSRKTYDTTYFNSAPTAWQRTFRLVVGFCTTNEMKTLRDGLAANDKRICQGCIAEPRLAGMLASRTGCEAADPIAFIGWQTYGLESVAEVEDYYKQMAILIGEYMGEEDGVKYFCNWWDETPRAEAFQLLLAEVELALSTFADRKPRCASCGAPGSLVRGEDGLKRHRMCIGGNPDAA